MDTLKAAGSASGDIYRDAYQAGYMTQRRGSFRTPNPYPSDAAKAAAWDQGYIHAAYIERHGLTHLHLPSNGDVGHSS